MACELIPLQINREMRISGICSIKGELREFRNGPVIELHLSKLLCNYIQQIPCLQAACIAKQDEEVEVEEEEQS